jgi:enoyl-CoA hydratase/carnithine racemase
VEAGLPKRTCDNTNNLAHAASDDDRRNAGRRHRRRAFSFNKPQHAAHRSRDVSMGPFKDIGVEKTGHVALVEIRRPPHNFFDVALIKELASAFEALDADTECRALVLAAQGKAFCAGADFGGDDSDGAALLSGPKPGAAHLYIEGNRLFRTKKPIVAAVHGAAVGGGLGLAMVADLRVTCPEARFCANFTRLGFHPGFGLTVTLPALIGPSKAALMFYTSRRLGGEEALTIGLADVLVPQDQVRGAALALAREIAENGPLGLIATRATVRGDIADRVRAATEHELAEQMRLQKTDDFKEGVKAMAERRVPVFTNR